MEIIKTFEEFHGLNESMNESGIADAIQDGIDKYYSSDSSSRKAKAAKEIAKFVEHDAKEVDKILMKTDEDDAMEALMENLNEAADLSTYVDKAIKQVEKGGGNAENLIQYGLKDIAGQIEAYSTGDEVIYGPKTITLLKRFIDSMVADEIKNNQPNP